jgi:hypothetical protein
VDLASGEGSVFVRTEQEIGTSILACVFQVFNFVLICYVSFQLVLRSMNFFISFSLPSHHVCLILACMSCHVSTVENDVTKLRKGFLAQSLVATVVNFGGIYFMMFLFQGNHMNT